MKEDRRKTDRFESGLSIKKLVSYILSAVITSLILFNFSHDNTQDTKIEENSRKIDVLKTSYNAHLEASGNIDQLKTKAINEKFDGMNKNISGLKKEVIIMSKNQLLIMRALNIKPVK